MNDRYIDFERKLKEHLCEKDTNHSLGKKTARERIEMLFDKGTFIELDSSLYFLSKRGCEY